MYCHTWSIKWYFHQRTVLDILGRPGSRAGVSSGDLGSDPPSAVIRRQGWSRHKSRKGTRTACGLRRPPSPKSGGEPTRLSWLGDNTTWCPGWPHLPECWEDYHKVSVSKSPIYSSVPPLETERVREDFFT